MSTIETNGATVAYEVTGVDGGRPVLLFHGTTMDRTAWAFVIAALPADHGLRCVTVEFPGSGDTPARSEPLTVAMLAADGAAVMAHLGHERYHVAGYSLGAAAAIATAVLHAEHVLTATLLCGWAVADARMRLTFDLWKRLIAADRELFMRYAFADGLTPDGIAALDGAVDEFVARGAPMIAGGSNAQLDLDAALDITELLPLVRVPTLVIGAEDDRWVDVRHSRSLAAAIDAARLEILPAGHMVIQERPADVAALLVAHVGS